LPQPVYAAELDFEKLAAHAKLLRTFQPLPSYPATQRDIAVVVPEDFEVAKVLELVKRVGANGWSK